MPPRTNDFQELVERIERLLADKGATVTRSKMMRGVGLDFDTEVDLVIETKWGTETITVAVEANGEKRPMTVEGIREYLGKYHTKCGVPVTRFVIVTRSGYRPNAKSLAAAHDVELLTVEELDEYDWTTFLPAKPAQFRFNVAPHVCRLASRPHVFPTPVLRNATLHCTCCGKRSRSSTTPERS